VVAPVPVGQYLAIPLDPFRGSTTKNDAILNGCAGLTNLFPLPGTHDWEVWYHGAVIGVLGLTRIVPGLDALAHFAFFDRQLYGRRQLVLTMAGWAFRELRLRRLSIEIPEHLDALVRFARAKLGFRFEGEVRCADHREVQALAKRRIHGPARWVARWGARREAAHFDGQEWRDLVCLRLMREEFDAMTNGVK